MLSFQIIGLCKKSKKDAREAIMHNFIWGGEYELHKKQCQFVLSLWVYERYGAKIPDKVISFVQEAAGKEPDDCEYLIKLERLW